MASGFLEKAEGGRGRHHAAKYLDYLFAQAGFAAAFRQPDQNMLDKGWLVKRNRSQQHGDPPGQIPAVYVLLLVEAYRNGQLVPESGVQA